MKNFKSFCCIFLFSFFQMGFLFSATTFKLAILAPEGTSWSTNLKSFSDEIQKQTEGRILFKIYSGGTQGDESDVLKKVRLGQLHGAFFTGKTLGDICSDVRLMELPFNFGRDEKKAQEVLKKVDQEFSQDFEKKSLKSLGFFGMGPVYFITKKKTSSLGELKGQKIWAWEGDKISETIIEKLQLTSVPLSLPDVLTSLSTGIIDGTYAPPMGIIALQWNTKTRYLLDFPLAYSIAAFIVDLKTWKGLDKKDQENFEKAATLMLKKLTEDSQRENADALEAMKKSGIEFFPLTANDHKEMVEVRQKAIDALKGKFFSPKAMVLIDQMKSK